MGYNSTKHNLVALLELRFWGLSRFVLDPPLKIEELSDYLKQLPDREQQVLNFYYRDGLTLREIAEIFGVSWSRSFQIKSNAINRLRRKIMSDREALEKLKQEEI